MEISAQYQIGSEIFRAVAIRDDWSWGNGIRVSIFDRDEVLWATTSFRCHPEFPDYDKYQAMTTSQLLEAAIKRLIDHGHAAIWSQRSGGIQVLFGLNGVGQSRIARIGEESNGDSRRS